MEEKKPKVEKFYKFLVWLVPILISVVSLCVSTVTSCKIQRDNAELQKELADQRENFEIDLKMQEAIPRLRLVKGENLYAKLNIFAPSRELKIVEIGKGIYSSESYLAINNFNFENIGDNIACFSHIEYGGVAYEFKELNLCVQKEEVVNFSSENKIIYLNFTDVITLVVKTLYGQYFSYDCILNSGNKTGNTRYCTVEQIDEPKLYNINNPIYEAMERHIRNIYFKNDNIIFGG